MQTIADLTTDDLKKIIKESVKETQSPHPITPWILKSRKASTKTIVKLGTKKFSALFCRQLRKFSRQSLSGI